MTMADNELPLKPLIHSIYLVNYNCMTTKTSHSLYLSCQLQLYDH